MTIHKIGYRMDPSNYRFIAIISLFFKMMEFIINSQFMRYLKEHQQNIDHQYDLRHGRLAGDHLALSTPMGCCNGE